MERDLDRERRFVRCGGMAHRVVQRDGKDECLAKHSERLVVRNEAVCNNKLCSQPKCDKICDNGLNSGFPG